MLPTSDILFRIYSGFIGKAIGVRLGAPVEPTIWSYERIRDTYGEVTGYLRDFTNFAADDDTNGPVYFIRAMRDYQLRPTANEVARTWLNYAAEGHGMYWWGGYGRSTEHTAYLNLRAGIEAPQSGSIAQNGAAVAEQIGGQIFIDSWGWVNPGNPQRAAEMSATAASVAHDGEGLNGARFVAAMIAAAFEARSVDALFEAGLAAIPANSTYAAVVNAVRAQRMTTPEDWRACRDMLTRDWGYDRYPGVCHIIPNAGVLALAIAYGEGDLCRTVEIATMCGWDTDCNAGNAGAIIGTFQGVTAAWDKYRKPINDMLVTSGVTGALNIVDIPTFARELTTLALQLDGRDAPAEWVLDMTRRGVRFDFALPGSTHGFRTAGTNQLELGWTDIETLGGTKGALEILIDRFERGQSGNVFWKPFYRKADFDDERYRPMFSPLVAAGQTVAFDLFLEPWEGDGHLRVVPYVRRTMSKTIEEVGAWTQPEAGKWTSVSFTVPEADGEAVDEIGVRIEYFGRMKFLGKLHLADFEVSGAGHTRIDPANEVEEWEAISRFTWNRGYWKLEDGRITGLTAADADIWTGHLYARDLTMRADIRPEAGTSHLVTVRAQGTGRFYAVGFENGRAVILKEDFGTTVLAEVDFPVERGRSYAVEATVQGDAIRFAVDGKPLLDARDDSFAFGQCGIRMGAPGRISVGVIEINEL
ncbi:ADP-ribosylglycohydrolase family protein [Pelagibacterium xiamenense]|uniref:ADP-ribosylglycohydrolase family protein n=1 Tax=Pelagibacterium xiamenense TaxID=2901140 RepID=UPI001E635B2B|nr:ADP-ribosylglycohydrolase family protein [Pelagibacterium xiamenense]MCD7058935.1 ADP-ribosylglycohydrolase family protein [Pelagibacterium xiamenense]